MTEAAPLQPPAPTETLTLSAPEPVKPVAATQAPALAPRIDEAAIPGLESKVSSYLDQLLTTDTRSPEFGAKADD
ncbi:MAG: toxic anion resistance protein, partial [Cellulosimicrobium funkei]